MTEQKHTKGPWRFIHGEVCYKSDHDDQSYGMWCPITQLHAAENWEANARRISACVNACEGIELSFIEALIPLKGFNSIIKSAADIKLSCDALDKENNSLISEKEALQARIKELERDRDLEKKIRKGCEHRIADFEAAITKMVKCKGRYHTEQNTIALAAMVGIKLSEIFGPDERDKKIVELEAQRDELLSTLKSIQEYWNGDRNNAAMADACEYAIYEASEAIAKIEAEKPL